MPLKIVMPEGTAEGALVQAGETRLVVKDGCARVSERRHARAPHAATPR